MTNEEKQDMNPLIPDDLKEILRLQKATFERKILDLEESIKLLEESIKLDEIQMRALKSNMGNIDALLNSNPSRESSDLPDPVNRATMRTETVIELAKKILGEQKRSNEEGPSDSTNPRIPMYYKDLADAVVDRGGDLRGNNPAQILVAQLVRDKETFVRPDRKGYYALREDYPKARNVGERKRRRSS
jgi:exonuclease VII small subunit